jgi:serine/threonine protein kinase
LSGGELFDRCRKVGVVSECAAKSYISAMVYAVKYCHANHIIHGDIKLENVIFEDETQSSGLKLIDFDTSKTFREGERHSTVMGTPFYMAPEVFEENCKLIN